MTKQDRARKILEYLDKTGAAFTKKQLFVNLRHFEDITFSKDTCDRRFDDFVDAGFVDVIDEGHPYIYINDTGREYLQELREQLE